MAAFALTPGLRVRKLLMEVGFRCPVSEGDILVSRFWKPGGLHHPLQHGLVPQSSHARLRRPSARHFLARLVTRTALAYQSRRGQRSTGSSHRSSTPDGRHLSAGIRCVGPWKFARDHSAASGGRFRASPSLSHTSASASASASTSASSWYGVGVMRKRSDPRGTVG